MRPVRWLPVLVSCVLVSCDNESTIEVKQNCFAACLDATASVDLEGQLSIAAELKDGFEHARVGLGSYVSVAKALTGFVQAMVDLEPSMPFGVTYAGNGQYLIQPSADTLAELQFYLASDTSFGSAGDRIEFNLFDVSNYFVSLGVKASTSVSLSGISTSLSLTFDGLGRGAELLGIAANATSPIAVDVSGFSQRLSRIVVAANVTVAHATRASTLSFEVVPTALPVGAAGSGVTALGVTNFTGQGLSLNQTLTLNAANLSMRDAASAFDGTLHFSSGSPSLSFDMMLNYSGTANADVVFGCPGVTLGVPE